MIVTHLKREGCLEKKLPKQQGLPYKQINPESAHSIKTTYNLNKNMLKTF
jgi:hypothetical protein